MSEFDDAIGEMTEDFLVEAGESVTYIRGGTSTTVTMRKSLLMPQVIENGAGLITEIRPVDFIALTDELPHDPPLRGDRIVAGGIIYEVQPTVGEKVFRRLSVQMTRIHTKKFLEVFAVE